MTDSPLTERGRQQARKLGEAVKASGVHIDEILYSPCLLYTSAKQSHTVALLAALRAAALFESSPVAQKKSPAHESVSGILGATGRIRCVYETVPPLHREFRLPLHYARKTVLKAVYGLSP